MLDPELHATSNRAAPPRARLELVRGSPTPAAVRGVPRAGAAGLTDCGRAGRRLGAIAAAGATGVSGIPLHLRPGAREWFMAWLSRAHPELVPRYEQLYARRAYVPAEYRTWLARRVAPLLAKHGLDRQKGGAARRSHRTATGVPGDEEVGFPAGSLPSDGLPVSGAAARRRPARGAPSRAAEQLALL